VIAKISLPCPFLITNRLVYTWPVLDWPKRNEPLDLVGAPLGHAVSSILSLHSNQRGLIHTVSYPRGDLLKTYCQSSRLIFHSPEDYNDALRRFDSIPDAVFCSPRALEGLDLRDDRCRFIVFIKLPFLFLGDARTKRRSDLSNSWYALKTATALIQGAGRGVRSADDYATTYILDRKARWWLTANKHLFPPYFREALKDFQTSGKLSEISKH
jgi:ATP-dependent DNA helicase DinG